MLVRTLVVGLLHTGDQEFTRAVAMQGARAVRREVRTPLPVHTSGTIVIWLGG